MKGYIKFLDCLFAAVAVLDFYNSLGIYPAYMVPALTHFRPALQAINIALTLAAIVFVIVFPIRWHQKERNGKVDPGLRHAWFTGIIRYWLAVEIFNYGFAKILGTQFDPSYFKGDSTWSSLSGLDLTWNYFSYSYTMSCIIAGVQIAGSALLLFRRTTLLGIIVLLPVMVNIVLIDVFYSLPGGALMNAVLFTLGLSYLLLLQWPALKAFFIQARPLLPAIRLGGVKHLLRLVLAAYAFTFIYYITTKWPPAKFNGKWRVDQLVRNGDTVKVNDWVTDSLAWKNVYLEQNGRAAFNPNPYVIEPARAMIGYYKYDEPKRTLRFVMSSPGKAADTLDASVTMSAADHMQWRIVQYKDTVTLALIKMPVNLHR